MRQPIRTHTEIEVPIEGTRGNLNMLLCEDADGLYVKAALYDGQIEPLKTPETVEDFPTTVAAIEWAIGYAASFFPGDQRGTCRHCGEDIEFDESSDSWVHENTGFTNCPVDVDDGDGDGSGFHAEPAT